MEETFTKPTIKNCTISDNTGIGISCALDGAMIINCTVSNNGGRGISVISFAVVDIADSRITQNSGGGLRCYDYSGLNIKNSVIDRNAAKNGGGISCSLTSRLYATDCFIVQNTATQFGGGIWALGAFGTVNIKYCTIAKNTAELKGGRLYYSSRGQPFALTNSIIWENTSDGTHNEIFASSPSLTIKSCDIEGGLDGMGRVNVKFLTYKDNIDEDPLADATIIDCEEKQNTRGFSFQNEETDASVLDGFTIKNGFHELGGGIYLSYASPTIKNCVIDGNRSIRSGAGIYCFNSDPIITDCKIKSNFGVGIYISGESIRDGIVLKDTSTQPTIEHCTISNNTGSGIIGFDSVNPLISNCTVSENGGRGIFYTFFARTNNPITNCRIEQNSGGGIECSETSVLIIKDSIIKQNTTKNGGGISCSPTSEIRVSDCIIVQNTATRDGGGIDVISTRGAATITHCTITQNTANRRGGGIHASIETGHFTLTDSIVWGNSSNGTHAEVFASGIVIAIKSCDIRNGLGSIGGNPDGKLFIYEDNIDEDPLFVDADSGDFRLKPNSPAAAMGAQAPHIGPTAVSQYGKRLVRWADLKRKPHITSIF